MKHLWKRHPQFFEEVVDKPKNDPIENLDKNLLTSMFSNKEKACNPKVEKGPPPVIPIAFLYPEVTVNQSYK